MSKPPTSVAVVGLGQMGSRYARRYLDAGFAVTVWNRTADRVRALVAAGARVARSAAEAVSAADYIIAALENAAAFESSLLSPQALVQFDPRHLVIDTSTVHPDAGHRAHDLLAARQARYLDAPVSGGTRGAEEGRLTLLVGGDPEDFERARPVLEVLGTPHFLGPTGSGQIAKLANQVIVAVTIGAVAEGLYLAQQAGLDGAAFLGALHGGFADSRILREHGDRMVRQDFKPGGANRVFMKDLKAIESLAAGLPTELPLVASSRHAYAELIAAGAGEDDHSSYFNYLAMINQGSSRD